VVQVALDLRLRRCGSSTNRQQIRSARTKGSQIVEYRVVREIKKMSVPINLSCDWGERELGIQPYRES